MSERARFRIEFSVGAMTGEDIEAYAERLQRAAAEMDRFTDADLSVDHVGMGEVVAAIEQIATIARRARASVINRPQPPEET